MNYSDLKIKGNPKDQIILGYCLVFGIAKFEDDRKKETSHTEILLSDNLHNVKIRY